MNQRRTPFRGAVDQLTRELVEAVLDVIRSALLPELATALSSQEASEPPTPTAAQGRKAAAEAKRAVAAARAPKGAVAKKARAPSEPEAHRTHDDHPGEDDPQWAGVTMITDPMALLKAAVPDAAEDAAAPVLPKILEPVAAPAPAPEPPPPPPPASRRIDAAPVARQGEDILRTGTGVVVLRRSGRRAHHAN